MMRRQDLVLDREAALSIIDEIHFAVLSLYDSGSKPYAVPLEYVRKGDVLYFHGAKEGRKVGAMKANPWGCAVIIGENELVPERFGRKYQSVIVEGPIELIDDTTVKRQVMAWVVERKSPDHLEKGQKVIEKMLDRVLIYKMQMEVVSGKHGL